MAKDIVTCKVDLGGIDEKLKGLETKIVRKLLRKALKAVAVYWIEAVKGAVPVLLGDLKNSITSKISTRKGAKGSGDLPSGTVQVGPGYIDRTDGKEKSQSPGVYGMFVEFGLKEKKYPKRPFMRPTFDSTADQAVNVFADALKDGLEDAVKD